MATAKADAPKARGAGGAQSNGASKIGAIDLSGRVKVSELRKPLYASVGVGDLAVEKLREVPTASTRTVKDLHGSVRGVPQQVRGSINGLQGKATSLYGELAQRGERLLSNISRAPTQAAGEQARAAIASAKAAGSTARRSVRSVAKPAAKPAVPSE